MSFSSGSDLQRSVVVHGGVSVAPAPVLHDPLLHPAGHLLQVAQPRVRVPASLAQPAAAARPRPRLGLCVPAEAGGALGPVRTLLESSNLGSDLTDSGLISVFRQLRRAASFVKIFLIFLTHEIFFSTCENMPLVWESEWCRWSGLARQLERSQRTCLSSSALSWRCTAAAAASLVVSRPEAKFSFLSSSLVVAVAGLGRR